MRIRDHAATAHVQPTHASTPAKPNEQPPAPSPDRYEHGGPRTAHTEWRGQPGAPPCPRDHELLVVVLATERESGRLGGALADFEAAYRGWRYGNPDAPEPGDGTRSVGDLLDDPSLSDHELCVRLIAVLLHEQPSLAGELHAAAAPLDAPMAAPAGTPPNGDPTQALLGVAGMGASALGGLLQNPLAIPVLSGACLLVPGLEPLALAVPFIAPIAGMALSGLGGMATQASQGQAPQLAMAAGAPGAADPLLGMLAGVVGGATGAPSAPVLPVPAR